MTGFENWPAGLCKPQGGCRRRRRPSKQQRRRSKELQLGSNGRACKSADSLADAAAAKQGACCCGWALSWCHLAHFTGDPTRAWRLRVMWTQASLHCGDEGALQRCCALPAALADHCRVLCSPGGCAVRPPPLPLMPGMRAAKAPPWFSRPSSFSGFLGMLATTLSGSDLLDDEDGRSELIQHAVEDAEEDLDLDKLDACTFGTHMCSPHAEGERVRVCECLAAYHWPLELDTPPACTSGAHLCGQGERQLPGAASAGP